MNQDLQTELQTDLETKKRKTRKANTELLNQPFSHQLTRLEKLLGKCGNRERQKLLLETLLQTY
jgi:TATA-binding protein-associated factor Taf7